MTVYLSQNPAQDLTLKSRVAQAVRWNDRVVCGRELIRQPLLLFSDLRRLGSSTVGVVLSPFRKLRAPKNTSVYFVEQLQNCGMGLVNLILRVVQASINIFGYLFGLISHPTIGMWVGAKVKNLERLRFQIFAPQLKGFMRQRGKDVRDYSFPASKQNVKVPVLESSYSRLNLSYGCNDLVVIKRKYKELLQSHHSQKKDLDEAKEILQKHLGQLTIRPNHSKPVTEFTQEVRKLEEETSDLSARKIKSHKTITSYYKELHSHVTEYLAGMGKKRDKELSKLQSKLSLSCEVLDVEDKINKAMLKPRRKIVWKIDTVHEYLAMLAKLLKKCPWLKGGGIEGSPERAKAVSQVAFRYYDKVSGLYLALMHAYYQVEEYEIVECLRRECETYMLSNYQGFRSSIRKIKLPLKETEKVRENLNKNLARILESGKLTALLTALHTKK